MGYRELLKKYIRHLEVHLGDNYIEAAARVPEPVLSSRDLGELRTIAAEIFREASGDAGPVRVANHNYRLRILLNRHGLSIDEAARISGFDADCIRRWRTQPRSRRYLPMKAAEYTRFEAALLEWLERSEPDRDGSCTGRS